MTIDRAQATDTYQFLGQPAQEADRLVHKLLWQSHFAPKATGPDGTPHSETKWFRLTSDAVADAVTAALGQKGRTIASYAARRA